MTGWGTVKTGAGWGSTSSAGSGDGLTKRESDFAPQTPLDRDRRRALDPVGAGGTGLVSTGLTEGGGPNRRQRPPGAGSLAPVEPSPEATTGFLQFVTVSFKSMD